MATRSAQTVSPYVAFSMLEPPMIVPSAVSRAAPTLKPEYRACAWRRARRAAAISARASEPGKNFLRQGDERAAYAACRLEDFFVVQGARQHACRHVRDARDSEHLEPHVAGGNRFRDGRHADHVGADAAEEPDFGRRFVARTRRRHVDAVRDG